MIPAKFIHNIVKLDQNHVYVQLEQGPTFHCKLMKTKQRKNNDTLDQLGIYYSKLTRVKK